MNNLIEKIDIFLNFIERMKTLNNNLKNNPYAQGIDIDRMLEDMDNYMKELKQEISSMENIPETPSETENTTVEE